MQLELDLHDRPVVIFGSTVATRRVLRRYAIAGARVTAVVDGPLPLPQERLVGVRYAVRPESEQPPDWMNLLAPSWLAVLVGSDPATADQVRELCSHLHIPVVTEPAALGHGVVTLVGGGPGVTGLLTVQACAALREADVVLFDRLAPTDDLARLAPTAELVDVGKRPHHHPVSQDEIEAQLVARALAGESVVRLKGGDPFVFGRGGEEVLACIAAGVEVHVVPGISSALSVPAAVGVPLTHRGVSRAFTVVSGHDPLSPSELSALAELDATLVILMGINNLPQITAGLVRSGLAPTTPAAVIERGYSEVQRTTVATVSTLAAECRRVGVQSPAVVVIGDVVRLLGRGSAGSAWPDLLAAAASGDAAHRESASSGRSPRDQGTP
jgi:uroporphyrin-III C-methyltransferase